VRIKALIGRLFHVGYIVEGTWKLMRPACPAGVMCAGTRRGWNPVGLERGGHDLGVWLP
jgi:hypothetical protein